MFDFENIFAKIKPTIKLASNSYAINKLVSFYGTYFPFEQVWPKAQISCTTILVSMSFLCKALGTMSKAAGKKKLTKLKVGVTPVNS